MMRLALFLSVLAFAHGGHAAETCRYTGTTSWSGRVTARTVVAATTGETTVDVTARLDAKSFGLLGFRYLHQEVSIWRDGDLRSVAVNHRYSFNGSIVRQQWDVFTAGPDGMTAFRAQGKTLADFRTRYPGFVSHWDPASFGQPWLDDYQASGPERRADLDLPRGAMPAGMGTPLSLAFYWVRWNTEDSRVVPVFLPGFKRDARFDVPVVLVDTGSDGVRHVRATVRQPRLSGVERSERPSGLPSGPPLAALPRAMPGSRAIGVCYG